MTTIKAFIKRHPVLTYIALTFAISWGGILIVIGFGPSGFSATPEQFQKAVPFAASQRCFSVPVWQAYC